MASLTDVKVPDIGDFSDVPVIEINVAVGDHINEEDPIVTLESDKATMEVPSPHAGVVKEILVKEGDAVSQGVAVIRMELAEDGAAGVPAAEAPEPEKPAEQPASSAPAAASAPAPAQAPATAPASEAASQEDVHAGPSVRRLARELEIDLTKVHGTGPKGRITKDDVKAFMKGPGGAPTAAAPASGAGIPTIKVPDFSQFGEIDKQPLSRIKRISGSHLHACWLNVPHVTHHDEADITDTEAYRKEMNELAKKEGGRVTLLAFIMKACVSALRKFPEVNASLSQDAQELIFKKYYNLGIAVDTPGGLVVPVIRDVDRKGVFELGEELSAVSLRARDGKLSPTDMSGGSFSISSLGGIGGTAFTPIVNAPEVAILGVTRSAMKPVWDGSEFKPRLMVPLSLSYDHRVIDGALAARFVAHLTHVLADVRRLVM